MRMDESNTPKFNWKSQLKAIPPLSLRTDLTGLTFSGGPLYSCVWRALEDRSILWWQAVAPLNSQEFFAGWAVCRDLRFPWRQHHPNLSIPGCVSRGGDLRKGPFPSYPQSQMFPAVPSGEPSYRSLLLVNKGPMLLTFSQAPNSSSDITLRPSSGLVAPGAHQVFLISTYPKGTSWKQHIFYLQFNFYPQYLKVGSRDGEAGSLGLNIFRVPTKVVCGCGWGTFL